MWRQAMQMLTGTRPRVGHATEWRTTSRVSPWQTTHARSGAVCAIGAPFSADSESSQQIVRPSPPVQEWPAGPLLGTSVPTDCDRWPCPDPSRGSRLLAGPVRDALPAPVAHRN
jgi:hypothetical protein